jgi:hypothetical protein
MARPERNNVDYFPYLCKEGKAMYYVETKYGNDGFATWVKLLRQLAVTNYHYLNLQDRIEFMFLASKCKITEETLSEIINDLCELGEFDKMLWHEYRVIFNQKFIDSIQDAYTKRSNECITYDGLLLLLTDLGIRKLDKSTLSGNVKPQRREEYSIEDKSIVKKIKKVSENKFSAAIEFKPIFEEFYFEKTKEKYYWTGKDAAKCKPLFNKLLFKIKEKKGGGASVENSEVVSGFKFLLSIISDNWILSNLSMAVIDSKFNEIIANKNGATKTQNGNNAERQQRTESVTNLQNLALGILEDFAAQNGNGSVQG